MDAAAFSTWSVASSCVFPRMVDGGSEELLCSGFFVFVFVFNQLDKQANCRQLLIIFLEIAKMAYCS